MTNNQYEILQFLRKFKSCTEEQLIFFTKCTIQDINYLIKENLIVKEDKTGLLRMKTTKKVNLKMCIALDVVKNINNFIKEFEYSKKYPIILNAITDCNETCDIAVVRHIEQEIFFTRLSDYTNADILIVVLENNQYDRSQINLKSSIIICTYPIKIIDKIN